MVWSHGPVASKYHGLLQSIGKYTDYGNFHAVSVRYVAIWGWLVVVGE